MMYALIVERKLRRIFAALNGGDFAPMLSRLAPRFEYRFEGDSAIGGLRCSAGAMAAWWQRLYRLFPGLQFEVQAVDVVGPPWNTRIYVRLEFRVPHAPDGPYRNVVMQQMRMRWGRIEHIHTLEDTQRCARFLAWRAAQGLDEALAAPITDRPWPEVGPFMTASPG
ncbi:nuclear transport factor 2 family protein [Aquincola sp. S2]|uniref:Nuclear transport factor 2 family protein n=1 Tax=Pseudaquabacterium terrae TaxID=2732868 RepID=A0ABX2EE78_9BURK|nr:nuclear transport factor 2 family protein [Aquabacterium terrae]NRF66911.1 nuclear transport factor 2 family protein [Aquabacterium terrae]